MPDNKFINLFGFLPTRVRRNDLPPIILLGIIYWMSSALVLYRIRLWMMLPDFSGAFGEHPFNDGQRVVAGVISSAIVLLFVAHLQVDDAGIPAGLTLKRAFLPVLIPFMYVGAAYPIVLKSTGSAEYGALVIITHCTVTIIVSLVLRALRRIS